MAWIAYNDIILIVVSRTKACVRNQFIETFFQLDFSRKSLIFVGCIVYFFPLALFSKKRSAYFVNPHSDNVAKHVIIVRRKHRQTSQYWTTASFRQSQPAVRNYTHHLTVSKPTARPHTLGGGEREGRKKD